ncbi:MAG: hypothetical protein WAY93_00550 [Atopobiaceae bacterium]|jgi:Tfp pilus assembly protein PilV|nr:hypothetical protein [Atopobiaceae bacterium]
MSGRHPTPGARAQRGETLTETLVAILVCALAAVVLMTAVVTAANVNSSARTRDDTMKTEESAASSLTSSTAEKYSGTVTFSTGAGSSSYNVYYSKGDGIVSYIDANS